MSQCRAVPSTVVMGLLMLVMMSVILVLELRNNPANAPLPVAASTDASSELAGQPPSSGTRSATTAPRFVPAVADATDDGLASVDAPTVKTRGRQPESTSSKSPAIETTQHASMAVYRGVERQTVNYVSAGSTGWKVEEMADEAATAKSEDAAANPPAPADQAAPDRKFSTSIYRGTRRQVTVFELSSASPAAGRETPADSSPEPDGDNPSALSAVDPRSSRPKNFWQTTSQPTARDVRAGSAAPDLNQAASEVSHVRHPYRSQTLHVSSV